MEIHSERIRIRPFVEADITEKYVSWLNDPNVVRYSEQRHRAHTLDSCRAFYDSFSNNDDLFLAVEDRKTANHIGNIVAYVDQPNASVNLTILIGDTSYWGKGLGREAWCMTVKNLLEYGGMRRVEAGTMEINRPMRALMRDAGMKEEGRMLGRFLVEGRAVDMLHFGVVKDLKLPAYEEKD